MATGVGSGGDIPDHKTRISLRVGLPPAARESSTARDRVGWTGRGLHLAGGGFFPPGTKYLVPFCVFYELLLVAESLNGARRS